MSLEKLVGLNDKHPRSCFTYEGQPLRADVTNTAWHTALRRAEIKDFRSDLGSAANRSVERVGEVGRVGEVFTGFTGPDALGEASHCAESR